MQHLTDDLSIRICELLSLNPEEVYSLNLHLEAGLPAALDLRMWKETPSGVEVTGGQYEVKRVETAV